jgi:hypothetical protein
MKTYLTSSTKTADCCKWYDCDEDILFVLERDGKESDDIWRSYYKNGKMQRVRAIIAFESYDPEKMA